MAERIRFGTDGWRAVIAREFTFANVAAVAQGIADTIRERGTAEGGVIVGYDSRFLSEQFAAEVAAVMAGNGIRSWVSDRDTPTPVLAHAVLTHQAAGAVILTASHNPAIYHGIKFVPEYASPAFPDVTDRIEAHTAEALARPEQVKRDDSGRLVESFDPQSAYFAKLAEVVDLDAIRSARLKVKVDCLHGAARGYLDRVLQQAGCDVEAFRVDRNPLFGGGMPDPSAERLKPLAERVVADGAHLGLAADGDGDRFGIIDASGRFLTPNQVIPLVLWHVQRTRFPTGTVARTVATTHMLDALADRLGLGVQETPVGFKYLGRALRETDAIVAGEESGGLGVRGHVPEKDGILAGLLVTEMVAKTGQSPLQSLERLEQEVGVFISKRLDLHVVDTGALMERVTAAPPSRLAGVEVADTVTLDGLKLIASDGRWMLLRPSGTEPLVRVYLEAHTPEDLAAMEVEALRLVGAGA
jgi:alpha-D-glucose phosphate-specific phosphoglucomutase